VVQEQIDIAKNVLVNLGKFTIHDFVKETIESYRMAKYHQLSVFMADLNRYELRDDAAKHPAFGIDTISNLNFKGASKYKIRKFVHELTRSPKAAPCSRLEFYNKRRW
jgi:hypothetical protein